MYIDDSSENLIILTAEDGKCIQDINHPECYGSQICFHPDNDSADNYAEIDECCHDAVVTDESREMREFWENFQENRVNYDYAFCNWTYEEIKPHYPILADRLSYMFMNCTKAKDLSNINIVVLADNPTMMGYCMNCGELQKPPTITFPNCPFVKTWTSAFSGCAKLTECVIDFGDDTLATINPITTRNNMQNTFFNCALLQDIEFRGKGSPKNLDLSGCTELSLESIQSLLEHLYDVSSATSGTYTIKVSSATMGLIEDYDDTATNPILEAFEDLGWTLEGGN